VLTVVAGPSTIRDLVSPARVHRVTYVARLVIVGFAKAIARKSPIEASKCGNVWRGESNGPIPVLAPKTAGVRDRQKPGRPQALVSTRGQRG